MEDVPAAATPVSLYFPGYFVDLRSLAPRQTGYLEEAEQLAGECVPSKPLVADRLPAAVNAGDVVLRLGEPVRKGREVRVPLSIENRSVLDPAVTWIKIRGLTDDGYPLDTG